MTRETKIGLLVGLGFIIVFAVVLSHTGTIPPVGDGLDVLAQRSGGSPAKLGVTTLEVPPTEPAGPAGGGRSVSRSPGTPSASPNQAPPPGIPDAGPGLALPRPNAFEPPLEENWYERAKREEPPPVAASPGPGGDEPGPMIVAANVPMERRAPVPAEPVAAPEPTPRPLAPARSPDPEVALVHADPPAPVTASPRKEHIVREGETLGEIARAVYGTAAVRVVEFLADSNKQRIKNVHQIRAGEVLFIPELPPDQFEPVRSFTPGHAPSPSIPDAESGRPPAKVTPQPPKEPDTTTVDRRAPKALVRMTPAVGGGVARPESDSAQEPKYRLHEIQPKDTLSSIARDVLGSEALWPEIQKLNPKIDPTRLKPRDKIRLPKEKLLSSAVGSGRSAP